MVKMAMENILNNLLKKSPNVKVGLVSFESEVEAMGDCLSKTIKLQSEYLHDESKIKEIGMNNTNIINAPIIAKNVKTNHIVLNARIITD